MNGLDLYSKLHLTEISLFSGAGGGCLASKWLLGHRIVAYVEINPYRQRVLQARITDGLLDDAPIWDDVRTLSRAVVDSAANLCYNSDSIDLEGIMSSRRKDYDHAVTLYKSGLSIKEVADFYNIHRQAMYKILKRRGVEFRGKLRFGEENHFFRGGVTASDRCQNILDHAIEKGIIERKTHCTVCGSTATFADGRTAIQAHHPDYNRPLEVMWLCQPCHHKWHKENRAILREEELREASRIDIISAGFP